MPPVTIIVGNFDGGEETPKLSKIHKKLRPECTCACVQTSNKGQWCNPRMYKICVLPMDVAGHDFNLGRQLCEQSPGLYFQQVCPSVLYKVQQGSNG